MAQRIVGDFEIISDTIGALPQQRTVEVPVVFESSVSTVEESYTKLALAGEVGRHLIPVYAAIVEAEPATKDALLIPYQDDEIPALAGFAAAAKAPHHTESSRAEMFINVSGWGAWTKIVRKRRHAIAAIAQKAGCDPGDIGPREFATFALSHEGGHVKRFAQFDFDPKTIEKDRWEGMETLPMPGVDPPSLIEARRLHPIKSYRYMRQHKNRLADLDIHSIGQLVAAQEQQYRRLPDEDFADRFAIDIMKTLAK